MKDLVIAVYGDTECGLSPVMPFVGKRFDGAHFTRLAKLYLSAALLRCGFDVFDPELSSRDPSELSIRINRKNVDAAIALSYAAFGSRKSFNGVCGFSVHCPVGRFYQGSRILGEDICAKLSDYCGEGRVLSDGSGTVNCPAVIVDVGFLTCFDEAKLVYDPDFAVAVAEHIAVGICEHFDKAYIRRDDISSYPLLCSARRGKKVKMLQCLLNASGTTIPIDGLFGGTTERAIKEFCADNGKPIDGAATATVWRDLLLLDLPELRFGSKNRAVRYIQSKLLSKLYPVDVDGVFGEKTLAALSEFIKDSVGGGAKFGKNDVIGADIYRLLTPVGGGRPRLI